MIRISQLGVRVTSPSGIATADVSGECCRTRDEKNYDLRLYCKRRSKALFGLDYVGKRKEAASSVDGGY